MPVNSMRRELLLIRKFIFTIDKNKFYTKLNIFLDLPKNSFMISQKAIEGQRVTFGRSAKKALYGFGQVFKFQGLDLF